MPKDNHLHESYLSTGNKENYPSFQVFMKKKEFFKIYFSIDWRSEDLRFSLLAKKLKSSAMEDRFKDLLPLPPRRLTKIRAYVKNIHSKIM